jgi:hypothetical protein
VTRILLAIVGLALLAYGGVLAWEFGASRTVNAVQGIAWFVGGPLIHDGLVAPAVGVLGLLLTRIVTQPWRTPVTIGLVLTAVLALLATPLLWRPFGVVTNPGLHDRNYGVGLAITLGVVWLAVIIAGLVRWRSSRLDHGQDQPAREKPAVS